MYLPVEASEVENLVIAITSKIDIIIHANSSIYFAGKRAEWNNICACSAGWCRRSRMHNHPYYFNGRLALEEDAGS